MKSKIKTRNEIKSIVDRLRNEGKVIVFTNGCFDLIHVGHIRYLQEAKKLGDHLIVAVNSDHSVKIIKGDQRPIVPEDERAEVLAALECVDFVVIFHEPDPYQIISLLKPHILVKGEDWSEEAIVGKDVVESIGGRVVRIPMTKGASTSNVIQKIVEFYSEG
ncbi:MAG: D-glycero-beta-D-manno-heptose 1-phosphate adenylyltransferase [Thermodesulfobacteriota bacterium]|nr:D-glycero-beta-D-manno-heptose 1-phosphate adenylyltransferase [Thermodesulfobacteriota bacterium]